jgi:Co/Zn/Cd efflux system component
MASYLASLPATQQHTFGLKRTESLAALFSMTSLALVSLWLAYEAILRISAPSPVDGGLMTVIAAIGVGVNLVLAWVLGEHHGKKMQCTYVTSSLFILTLLPHDASSQYISLEVEDMIIVMVIAVVMTMRKRVDTKILLATTADTTAITTRTKTTTTLAMIRIHIPIHIRTHMDIRTTWSLQKSRQLQLKQTVSSKRDEVTTTSTMGLWRHPSTPMKFIHHARRKNNGT